jgi:transcriptional regulator with XRE-family HTH domain
LRPSHTRHEYTEATPVNPLQELIRTRMAEQRWSLADVARRGMLPHSTVHYLATNERPSRPPHPRTISRLAQGLDLPADQVRAAAAQAVGYTVMAEAGKDPDVEILVAALGQLSPQDRRHVTALVRSLLERGAAVGGAGDGADERDRGGEPDGDAKWPEAGDRVREPLPHPGPEQ